MKMYVLKQKQILEASLSEVFSFFEKPENLDRITPPELHFRILTPLPVKMEQGRLIDYQIRLGGLPFSWRTLITDYRTPTMFVDQQIKGPYVFWHHTHRFSGQDGHTVIEDEVRYVLPFGVLGRFLHRFLIRRKLESIFAFRRSMIARIFGEDEN